MARGHVLRARCRLCFAIPRQRVPSGPHDQLRLQLSTTCDDNGSYEYAISYGIRTFTMTSDTIDHATLTKLAEAGTVRSARIVGQPGG